MKQVSSSDHYLGIPRELGARGKRKLGFWDSEEGSLQHEKLMSVNKSYEHDSMLKQNVLNEEGWRKHKHLLRLSLIVNIVK